MFAAFAALRMYLVNWIGERVVADLRSAVYRRVIRMDPAFFEVTKTGEVLSRLTTDTTLIQSLSGIGLSILLRSTVSFLGSLVLLLLTSLKLALIIFALIPTVLAAHAALRPARAPPVARLAGSRRRHLGPRRRNAQRHPDRAGLHARGAARRAATTTAVEKSFDTAVRRTRVRAWLIAAAIMTMFSAVTLVLWLGARSVLHGTMTGGDLAQIPELRHLHGHRRWRRCRRCGASCSAPSGAMERTVELLESRPSIAMPANPVRAQSVPSGQIRFEHLTLQLSLAARYARARRFPSRHRAG